MNNAALVKLVALLSGAALGVALARWSEDLVASRAKERREYDRSRYAQGLAPTSLRPAVDRRKE